MGINQLMVTTFSFLGRQTIPLKLKLCRDRGL